MTARRILGDKRQRSRRVRKRTAPMLLLLLLLIGISAFADAERLGHSMILHRPRLLQNDITNDTSNASSSKKVSASDGGKVDASLRDGSANGALVDSNETPSPVMNHKGTPVETASYHFDEMKDSRFTDLEDEDIPMIMREGASPIQLLVGSRGLTFCILLGICATIFTAWQVAENPDGAYSSLCRWTVSMIGFLVRILVFPFCMCCKFSDQGHIPLATSDYGYKDPSLEFS